MPRKTCKRQLGYLARRVALNIYRQLQNTNFKGHLKRAGKRSEVKGDQHHGKDYWD